jgi:glycosyltransferase involved in cell wall biosynthesis
MPKPYRLLTIAHAYVVACNRQLPQVLAQHQGWEVTVVAPPRLQFDFRRYTLTPDLQTTYTLKMIPIYGSQKPQLMVYGWGLRSLLQNPWDLVHAWQEPYTLAGAQIAALMPPSTPLVYTTHQSHAKQYLPPFNALEQWTIHRAAGWIGCGQTGLAALRSRPGYQQKPRRIIPYGVDACQFYPDRDRTRWIRQHLDWPEAGEPVIGFLGRLVSEKGLELLIQILDTLTTPWRLLIVGTGPLEAKLRCWAEPYGDRIRLCTQVPHAEVPLYLNGMDVLVAPSQTTPRWKEQFGRMIIEAFACGVPVVGSDSGEIPYVIADAGLVVGEQDVLGWVNALTTILENPAYRRELATAGLERANQLYTWERVAQQHLEFFTELLAYSGSSFNCNLESERR